MKNKIDLKLPASYEPRKAEFEKYLTDAQDRIRTFSKKYGWEELVKEPFMDKVMIFDQKSEFDKMLLELTESDPTLELPETYCGALEQRILTIVSPEIYEKVFPQGIEDEFYSKIMAHEIAHRLHIRILGGDEEAMGPVWFFEGFALFAADQFSHSKLVLSKDEMIDIIKNEERGSYENYAYIFRYVAELLPLTELVKKAGEEGFNEHIVQVLGLGS
ncbi:MAG: hypothetical protein JXR69_06700 [Candidatus Delongbacteria bacterium]|nr:hypothetical protein [Candidatus Delongbacteria bacterium]